MSTMAISYQFNTFPQCQVEQEGRLSLFLRSTMRAFNLAVLPEALFEWNPMLEGGMEVICSRLYGPGDVTRNGISKEDWRLVWIQGDRAFLESLRHLSENYLFRLYPERVPIRGGIRRDYVAKELKPVVTHYKIDRTGSTDSVDCSGIRMPRLPVLTNPSAASQERPRVVDLTMVSDEVAEVTID